LNSKFVSELEKGWYNYNLQLYWQVSCHTHHRIESAGQSKISKRRNGDVKRLSTYNLPGNTDNIIRIYYKII